MHASERTLSNPENFLIFGRAASYRDYVAASSRQEFLRIRDREIRISAVDQEFFTAYPDVVYWLAVVADDNPDSLVVLPVLAHVAACVPRLALRVVNEEEAARLLPTLVSDPELLASWADADLPMLLSFDEEWQFQEQWGPHPQAIDPLLDQWLAEHSDLDQLAEDESPAGQAAYARVLEQLLYELRLWYNSSLNYACGEELHALLARWHEENGDE